MDRKGFFKTLGFLGMGIVASKVIPEVKKAVISNKWDNDKWSTVPMKKSIHRNNAGIWGMFDDKFLNGEYKIVIPKDRNLYAFIEDIKGQKYIL